MVTLLPPLLQVIMKDGIGITSFGTVSLFMLSSHPVHTRRSSGRLQQRPRICHAGAVISFALAPCTQPTVQCLQVMFEQTPTQYDIIIRNVSAAGAVVYNGSAAGNNMIGLKLHWP